MSLVSPVVLAAPEDQVALVDLVVLMDPEVLSVREVPMDLAVQEVLLEAREMLLVSLAVKEGLEVHWALADLVVQEAPVVLLGLAVPVGRTARTVQAVQMDLPVETYP